MPLSRILGIDLETSGNGPNDVCEIGWQDVVLGADGHWPSMRSAGRYWLILAVQCRSIQLQCITCSTGSSPTPRFGETSLRASCVHRTVSLRWRRTGRRSNSDTVRRGSRALRPGSVRGNARCAYGRIFNGFSTRCFAISACRKVWCKSSGCRLIEPCQMPM